MLTFYGEEMIKIKKPHSIIAGLIGFSLALHSGLGVAQTANERLATCNNDPRVITGQVTAEICAGADIFFRATFDGNGRTCGSCHRAEDNFTISPEFIATLPNNDALFVAEHNPNLSTLERPELLRNFALILENVDGQDDLDNKFTMRSIPHTLSMATSLSVSPGDGTTTPPLERTGWSGDGAPNDGTLRDFLTGAVAQHFTSDLSRTPGTSFTLPNEQELDLALAYQMALGRTNEIDLNALTLTDTDAQAGIALFQGAGRCNACHLNAGANFIVDGTNRNFNTGVDSIRIPEVDLAFIPSDGGFGQEGSDTDGDGVNDIFGNGSFNSAPLIEAADTAPFFHTNAFNTIEEAVAFYTTAEFAASPSGQVGGPIVLTNDQINQVARLLRVLNTALNIDMAIQRLNSALALFTDFQSGEFEGQFSPDQLNAATADLAQFSFFELEDAIQVLDGAPNELHAFAQNRLNAAIRQVDNALRVGSPNARINALNNAVRFATQARNELGEGINYTLGEGNIVR